MTKRRRTCEPIKPAPPVMMMFLLKLLIINIFYFLNPNSKECNIVETFIVFSIIKQMEMINNESTDVIKHPVIHELLSERVCANFDNERTPSNKK